MRKQYIAVLALAILIAIACFGTTTSAGKDHRGGKVFVCHPTTSADNPIVVIRVNEKSIDAGDFPYAGPINGKDRPTKDGVAWCTDNQPSTETPAPAPVPTPTPQGATPADTLPANASNVFQGK